MTTKFDFNSPLIFLWVWVSRGVGFGIFLVLNIERSCISTARRNDLTDYKSFGVELEDEVGLSPKFSVAGSKGLLGLSLVVVGAFSELSVVVA